MLSSIGKNSLPIEIQPRRSRRSRAFRCLIREQRRGSYATGGNGAICYGLGITEHSQGSTAVMALANLAMATGNIGRPGVGVNPLRGQNNVQGSCDMGSFPHELSGYRHVATNSVREMFEIDWGATLKKEPGLRIPNMLDAAVDGTFKGIYIQGEDILQSDPDTKHVAAGLAAMECVVVQDLFLNETALTPTSSCRVRLSSKERHLHQCRTPHPVGAQGGGAKNGYDDWDITCPISNAMGYPMNYDHPSQIMDEIARLTPTFAGVSFKRIEELGSIQWPCNEKAPLGTPVMHIDTLVRGKGRFLITEYVATDEKVGPRFPLLLTTGRILSAIQCRRADTAHRQRRVACRYGLEIHPNDAEERGIRDSDWLSPSEVVPGETSLRAKITDRLALGVVYTTFHHPDTQANVITTNYSDGKQTAPNTR